MYLGEIFNFWSENAILLGKFPTSESRIELYLAQARNLLVERLSLMTADTITLRQVDSILFAQEKFSACCRRMPFGLGEFQLPAGELSSTYHTRSTF